MKAVFDGGKIRTNQQKKKKNGENNIGIEPEYKKKKPQHPQDTLLATKKRAYFFPKHKWILNSVVWEIKFSIKLCSTFSK